MTSTTTKVDEKGRVIIPKRFRENAKLKEGGYVTIKAEGKKIILEPLEPVAEKYYGAFNITKWPENIDEFILEVTRKWWTHKPT